MRALERAVADRRHEAVYVHPRWLMQQTELERDALARLFGKSISLKWWSTFPRFADAPFISVNAGSVSSN